jgi:DNA-binding transcriptional MerR regulator
MPIAGMQAFAALRAQGQPTMGARRDLLVAHRDAVLARIAELQNNLGAILDKIAYYEKAAEQNAVAGNPARQIDASSTHSHSDEDSP